jgi:hydrogenase maturation protein HypF
VPETMPSCLAVGGQQKNSVAISSGRHAFLSQHIGELSSRETFDVLKRTAGSLSKIYELNPEIVVCDLHPDYLSTKFASGLEAAKMGVQHHYAHVLSCLAENQVTGPVLGVAWDGTGLGDDGTIWGGEFIVVDGSGLRRAAYLRPFRLPGNERAVMEPRRSAIGVLFEIYGEELFSMEGIKSLESFDVTERGVIHRMLTGVVNCPLTTSAGRLFDAVASITGVRQKTSFEGQAAMELEFAAEGRGTDGVYEFRITDAGGQYLIDWEPVINAILSDMHDPSVSPLAAAKFHNTLARIISDVAQLIGLKAVLLTGGCFQNKYLTERASGALKSAGFKPYWHCRVPPNDGGIALGQIMAATHVYRGET